jgi:2'-5' RNA ligase
MHFYFIAHLVKEPARSCIIELQKEMCKRYNVCQSLKSPPHVTIIPPFYAEQEVEKIICKKLNSKSWPVIKSMASGLSHFDDRVIYIDLANKNEFEQSRIKLNELIKSLHIPIKPDPSFHPHITIGHRNMKPVFESAWDHFSNYDIELDIEFSNPILLKHDGQMWQVICPKSIK